MSDRFATLKNELRGKFTTWKEGEVVKVHHVRGKTWSIEKLKRKRAGICKEGLPLFNELAGVPRSAFTLNEP